jgi:hypothetical protein
MVNVELAFCPMLDGENASATVGGVGAVTVKVEELVFVFEPAGPVVSAADAMVLV